MMQPMSPTSLPRRGLRLAPVLATAPLTAALFSELALAAAPAHAVGGNDNCEVTGCGGNTPILFGSPIIGLSLKSEANSRGVVLDPLLARVAPPVVAAGACPDGAILDVANGGTQKGELIGRWGSGVCSREGLIGMAFTLYVPTTPCGELPTHGNPVPCGRKERIRVRIDAVSSVPTWAVTDSEQIITYQLVWHELPESLITEGFVLGESICPLREAWMEDWQNGSPTTGAPPGYQRWKEETDQLLIVHGETYHADARVDLLRRGQQWLNLGCVGSALAKSRLLNNNPWAAMPQWSFRQATLKMLTGRYQGQRSYTSPGVPLYYSRWDGKAFHGTPMSGVSGSPEADWNANGAMCLSHRRTWKATALDGLAPMTALANWLLEARPEGPPENDDGPVILPPNPDVFALYADAEEETLQPLRDSGIGTCAVARAVGSLWRTYPVNHTPH
jgi:hypothetical protein